MEAMKGRNIEVGDAGIWMTCMRGKERQAAAEFLDICNEVRGAALIEEDIALIG